MASRKFLTLIPALVAVLGFSGCAAPTPPSSADAIAAFAGEFTSEAIDLVGLWNATVPGIEGESVVLFTSRRYVASTGCHEAGGTWAAASSQFLSQLGMSSGDCFGELSSGSIDWLANARTFGVIGDGIEFRDSRARVVARLVPRESAVFGGHKYRAPTLTTAERDALAGPVPLPAGVTALTADELIGTWSAADYSGRSDKRLIIDRESWKVEGRCYKGGAGFVLLPNGRWLTTAPSAFTAEMCVEPNAARPIENAERVGLDGDTLVFFDAAGHASISFVRG